jgi:hypothetical protein
VIFTEVISHELPLNTSSITSSRLSKSGPTTPTTPTTSCPVAAIMTLSRLSVCEEEVRQIQLRKFSPVCVLGQCLAP